MIVYILGIANICAFCDFGTAEMTSKTEWPKRNDFTLGKYNVKYITLIDPQKFYLPPLHIKLGLFTKFVKAVNEDGKGFKYLSERFISSKSLK